MHGGAHLIILFFPAIQKIGNSDKLSKKVSNYTMSHYSVTTHLAKSHNCTKIRALTMMASNWAGPLHIFHTNILHSGSLKILWLSSTTNVTPFCLCAVVTQSFVAPLPYSHGQNLQLLKTNVFLSSCRPTRKKESGGNALESQNMG